MRRKRSRENRQNLSFSKMKKKRNAEKLRRRRNESNRTRLLKSSIESKRK